MDLVAMWREATKQYAEMGDAVSATAFALAVEEFDRKRKESR